MKYIVTATNGETTRDEEINTKENYIFRPCLTSEDVKIMYEAYWSPGQENIKVLSVREVQS